MLVGAAGSKVIITSRQRTDLSFLSSDCLHPIPMPPVARFPVGPPHVQNVLGAFAGLTEYPEMLLQAIDRHPFLAVLAGLYLRARGANANHSEAFIRELRQRMRSALFAR